MNIYLITFIALLLIAIFFWWPVNGIYARFVRYKKDRQRILIEDSLKLIFNLGYDNLEVNDDSVRNGLKLTFKTNRRLLDKLLSLRLIEKDEERIVLSSEGRAYALRVIRIHRLLEKYFADATSYPESQWHRHAENREHHLTETETEQLSITLGNPGFDPHGDPIPDQYGDMPELQGMPFLHLSSGDYARILHIEDEPANTYSQIIALGLHPGTQVLMIDLTPDRLRFEANGEDCVLSPLIAGSITVKKIDETETIPKNHKILTDLKPGEEGEIVSLSSACHGMQRRRLMDLGIVPGSSIMPELVSFSGDPTAYRVRGALIALRKEQSRQILVKPIEKEIHAES
jgi:DtxR family Mn-dependent transcriptional regulator